MRVAPIVLALYTMGGASLPPVTASLVDGGRRYRTLCSAHSDKPGSQTGTLTLSLLAEDEKSAALLWSSPLRQIWGAYGLADCARLGYEVDRLAVATLGKGPRTLLAHTPDGSWFLTSAASGRPIAQELWAQASTLPLSENTLALVHAKRIPIAAQPGQAFLFELRNDGPTLALESHYRQLALEVSTSPSGWRRVAEERAFDPELRLVERGHEVEIFVSAESATALMRAGRSPGRLGFLVMEIDADGRPTIPIRALVSLPPATLELLTRP